MAAPTKAELQARVAKLERALARERKRKGVAADLVRARAAQAAATKILRVIRKSPSDVRPVFEAIADAALRLFDAWSVLVVQFDGKQIQYGAARGARRGSEARTRAMFPMPLSKATTIGPVGRCIISRKIIELPDARRDRNREMRALAKARGFRSTFAVPLMNANVPIGAIGVTRVEAGRYTRAEIDLLQTFADQAVIAIENARRFDETRAALAEQKASGEVLTAIAGSMSDATPVFDRILEACERLFTGYIAGINVIGDDGLVHLAAYRGPKPEAYARLFPMKNSPDSATGIALATRKTLHYPDLEAPGVPRGPRESGRATGVRSAIMAPLLAEEGGIGSIYVTRKFADPFTEREIARLEGFANQATIAIKNARQFRETKEALERQTATADILKVISGSPNDVQPVFDAVAHSSMRLLGALSASVSIRVGDTLQLGAFTSTSKKGDQAVKDLFPLSLTRNRDTILAQSVLNATPAQVGDAQGTRRRPRLRQIARRRGFQSIIAVPMLSKGSAIGTVSVTRREAGGFSAHEVELLTTFADQAVIAIENVRLFNETKEALEHQTATSDVLGVISTSPTDVQPVLDVIAESAARLCESSDAQVLLCADGGLRITAQHGSEIRSTVGTSLPMNRDSATARAVIDATVVHVADVAALPAGELKQTKKNAADSGWQSILSVPLLREGTAVGAIAARRSQASPFTPRQIALLKTFADQAVIAIENVRLFNETKEALERQTATAEVLRVIASSPSDIQPVFDAIAHSANQLLGGYSTAVTRLIDDSFHLVGFTTTSPEGDAALKKGFPVRATETGLIDSLMRHRAPVRVVDTESGTDVTDRLRVLARARGFRSMLIVPLLREDAVIGAISVTRQKPGEFQDHDVDLLRTFADQAVIAIENVRLFNETKESLERQTATAEVLRAISASPTDTEPVFDIIAERAATLCGARDSAVMRYDGRLVHLAAHYNLAPEAGEALQRAFPCTLEHNSTGVQTIRTGRVVQIRDVSELPDYHLADVAQLGGARRILGVPLMRSGRAIGAVVVAHGEPGQFSEHQIGLVKTFADQAVIAIENVRLFNETKEALEQQTASAEILRIISESPTDVQPVFDAIARTSLRLFPDSHIALSRAEEGQVHLKAIASPDPDSAARLSAVFPIPLTREYITGTAILDCRTISVSDTTHPEGALAAGIQNFARSGFRANTTVPMVRNRIAIGALSVVRSSPGTMSENQVALLRGFADQAVIAIENVRLFNETKEALEQQTASAEILRTIASAHTDAQPVFQAIIDSALSLCDAVIGVTFLFDGERVNIAALAGFTPEAEAAYRGTFPLALTRENITTRAIVDRKRVHVPDIEADETFPVSTQLHESLDFRAVLAVPMLRDGQPVGVITVARRAPGPFSDRQTTLLESFADQAVIAIENVRLFNETKEALERQTATAEILRVISSSPTDVQPVFDMIGKLAGKLCIADISAVARFDGEKLQLVALEGVAEDGVEFIRRAFPMYPGEETVIARAFDKCDVEHVADVMDSPSYARKSAARGSGYRGCLGVPMIREGNVIGVIFVARVVPGYFADSQVALLETFADQAVIAIENVRLFNETKEALERQTATAEILEVMSRSQSDLQPVFDTIAGSAMRLCDSDQGLVYSYDGALVHIASLQSMTPEGEAATRKLFPMPATRGYGTGRAILTRAPVQVADVFEDPEYEITDTARVTGWRSVLAIPMLRAGMPIGGIAVVRRQPMAFTDHEVALLKTFADQAVIAIENVRLFNETNESLERQTATAEILKVISSSPTDVQPVFDSIAKSARQLIGGRSAVVVRRVADQLHLESVTATTADADDALRKAFPTPLTGQAALGKAILSGQPAYSADVEVDEAFSDAYRETMRARGTRSFVAVPMMREGVAVGGIAVTRGTAGPFSEHQINLLQTFADQAVIAIENVRLFNETKEALERQTATAEILEVMSGSPTDVQPVFDAIVSSAARLFAPYDATVTLLEDGMFHFRAWAGARDSQYDLASVKSVFPFPFDSDRAPSARAIAERRIVEIADIDAPGAFSLARSSGQALRFRSGVWVPLLREGEGIGTLVLTQAAPGLPMTEKQLALLKTFADQAVIAIENVRLFNETKEALERQTATAEILRVISASPTDVQPVFEAIVASAARLCDAVQSAAVTREDGMLHLVAHRNWTGEGRTLAESLFPMPVDRDHLTAIAVRENRVIHSVNLQHDPEAPASSRDLAIAQGYDALLIVPMLREGRSRGAVVVARKSPFTEHQIALLQTFADQAVIAIDNVRLFNETREALERQTATAEILEVISRSQSDLQPVFDTIADSAMRLCGGHQGMVFSYDGAQIHISSLKAMTPEGEAATQALYPKIADRANMTGRAILTRATAHSADVLQEPDYEIGETARIAGWRSVLSVPMLRAGNPIGAITVIRRQPVKFSNHQITLLKTFADQAVIAIENVRLFNETKESLERQTATAEILKVISSSPTDVQPVLETVAEYAARLCEADRAFIFRFDGEFLRSAVTLNASPELREFVERNPIRPGQHSATARAGLEKRTIHVPDVAADLNYSYGAKDVDPIRTVLTVPMLKGDELLGVILTYRLEVKPFTEKQIALIETFADQAVIAIENVRLFNETKEALEQQRASGEVLSVISNSIADAQPVFEKIVESCERLFAGSKVGLNLVGPDGLVHAGAYGKFPGVDKLRTEGFPHPANEESATGAAILARDVIHYPDVLGDSNVPFYARRGAEAVGFRSFIMAPLLSEGRGLGAIFVGRETAGTFTEKEIALLKTFANQAVIAIQNARLFNETKEALERQTATADILKVISESPTDVQPVFDAITRSGVHLFRECIAGILMKEGDQLALRGLAGPTQVDTDAMVRTFPIPFDPETSLVARTIATCEVTQILDSEAPDAPEYVKKAGRAVGFRSLTAAPLIRDGVGIGAISIASPEAGIRLSEKQISLLKTFADQAVIAIENVRLFREIQQRTEALSKSVGQLTALGEVSQALSSTLDLEKVLQTIVARAVQLTGLDGGAIYEYDENQRGFRVRSAEHLPEEAIAMFRAEPMRLGEGAIGRAGLTREAVQIPDIHEESYKSRVRELLIRSGSRALLAVPLLREGHLLGALAVLRNTPGEFGPEIVELMKTFATQSAIAIQNARLFREIEEKGRELELASQHKSQFLASMSHELRTPLNAILGFNEMILGEVYGEVPADMKEPLEDIQTSGKHLLRLINNVLDLAKIEAGRMELALADYSVHDMVESVRTTLRPLAEAKGLEFLASVPNDLPLAHGDSGRLTQCLMNLAGNSLKFTKEGNVSISVEPNGETLAFRVADTGIGIPPDKIDNLFTEFKQTDATIASEYGGTGLGLSITKKFIEMHGGRIWVESELGKGSSFIFEIPLRVETGAAA